MFNEFEYYIIFDSDCGMCSALADFVEKNKRINSMKIIPSALFDDFNKFNIDRKKAESTVIFIDNINEKVYYKTPAVMGIVRNLKGIYRFCGYLFANSFFAFCFDPLYDIVAKNRAYISSKLGLKACKIK